MEKEKSEKGETHIGNTGCEIHRIYEESIGVVPEECIKRLFDTFGHCGRNATGLLVTKDDRGIFTDSAEREETADLHSDRTCFHAMESHGNIGIETHVAESSAVSALDRQFPQMLHERRIDRPQVIDVSRFAIGGIDEIRQQRLEAAPWLCVQWLQRARPAHGNEPSIIPVAVDEPQRAHRRLHPVPPERTLRSHHGVPRPEPVIPPRRCTGNAILLRHTRLDEAGNRGRKISDAWVAGHQHARRG